MPLLAGWALQEGWIDPPLLSHERTTCAFVLKDNTPETWSPGHKLANINAQVKGRLRGCGRGHRAKV